MKQDDGRIHPTDEVLDATPGIYRTSDSTYRTTLDGMSRHRSPPSTTIRRSSRPSASVKS
jgi:hypothetical protein